MKTLLALLLFSTQIVFAQSKGKRFMPTSVAAIQYAGSIGWFSAGYFRQSTNEKTEIGILYGYTPEFVGGTIHTITLKFIYEPFRLNVEKDFELEPIHTGLFIAQHFGRDLYLSWPDKYEAGYYAWTPSTRLHFFFASQASYIIDNDVIRKISFYFETNTNDLYVKSYVSNDNWHSLGLGDIFFFGLGAKVYFK